MNGSISIKFQNLKMIDEEIHVYFIDILCFRTLENPAFEAVARQNLSQLFALKIKIAALT